MHQNNIIYLGCEQQSFEGAEATLAEGKWKLFQGGFSQFEKKYVVLFSIEKVTFRPL